MFEADRSIGGNRWPVVRLVAGSRTEVILLSQSFFALTTHWVGHTVLCSVDACVLCETLPARGLFYVAVLCAGRCSILELGAQSASHFEQHAKLLHGGLRPGLVVELARRGAKTPVHSEVVGCRPDTNAVTPLDLCTRVMAIYKFPPPQPNESMEAYEKRCQVAAQRRNEQIERRLRHSTTGRVGGR